MWQTELYLTILNFLVGLMRVAFFGNVSLGCCNLDRNSDYHSLHLIVMKICSCENIGMEKEAEELQFFRIRHE